MRDARLNDLFQCFAQVSGRFVSAQSNATHLAWLQNAVEEWRTECELPPGCKIIKLDKWLLKKERSEEFCDFVAYVATLLRSETHADPILASEADRVWHLVRNLEGKIWVE